MNTIELIEEISSYTGGIFTVFSPLTAKKGRILAVRGCASGRIEFLLRFKWKLAGLVYKDLEWPLTNIWVPVTKRKGHQVIGDIQKQEMIHREGGVLQICPPVSRGVCHSIFLEPR